MDSVVTLLFFALTWLVSIWAFYMIIKAAVRNGILEADARRSASKRRPYADLSDAELKARIAAHEGRDLG